MKEKVENLLVEAHVSAKLYPYDEASINFFDGLITAYEKVLKIMEEENK
ncbi:hypothetical protein [Bacillus phage SWEP1]|nr:hypothetical protein [Bacillus phage SWEP1]